MPLLTLLACTAVDSNAEAELAYIGLDTAVTRALELGLQGFAEASSATIDAQSTEGDVSGSMTVSGQADQGSSDNKGLRLDLLLHDYADVTDLDEDDDTEVVVEYNTNAEHMPAYDMQLRDMPDGTMSGTLVGTFTMDGDLIGDIELNVSIEGPTEAGEVGEATRVAGETEITGTATNDAGGVFEIDLTR